MLGITQPPSWTKVIGRFGSRIKPFHRGTFQFINNEFFGADGAAFEYDGENTIIENNLFGYNDWSGYRWTVISNGVGDNFVRNTLAYNGASTGYRPWGTPHVELNHIYGQCWGMIQNDGSGIQFQRRAQSHGTINRNWVHSSPKFGIRFDDSNPPRTPLASDGTITRNIVWASGGIMVKGDR